MDPIVNAIDMLNAVGQRFCAHAGSVLIQSSLLIGILLAVDFLLRRRVRAVVRYALWMLVFVKLLLPPGLSLPTGIGYYRPRPTPVVREVAEPVEDYAFARQPVGLMPPLPAPVADRVAVAPARCRWMIPCGHRLSLLHPAPH